jgi:hypothetical protein
MVNASTTVLRDRFVPGNAAEGVCTLPLAGVLRLAYRSDAHFQGGVAADGLRLTRSSLDRGTATMTVLAVDIDAPGHQATAEWRAATRQRITELFEAHPGGFGYETRGGARVVYTLAEPFVIETHEDGREWSRRYLTQVAYLARRFDLACDAACADFSRLFRCPRATRDGELQRPATFGNPDEIAALVAEITAEDEARAREMAPQLWRSESGIILHARSEATPRGAERREREPDPDASPGVLYELLEVRGDVLRPGPLRGSFLVKCPRERFHTTGKAGDGSTLLFVADVLFGPGAIHCKHAGCARVRSAKRWKREIAALDASERKAAAGGCDSSRSALRAEGDR